MKLQKFNEEHVIELYKSGKSLVEISKIYGTPTRTKQVKNILVKNNIEIRSNRKRALNENFFEKIDTKEKAYLLGLIVSDGSIDNTGYGFSFISKDLDLVELFKEKIESEHKICKVESFDKRTNKTYTRYTLHICSKLIVKHLNNLGITNNKSFSCDLPEIKKELFWHFIRGLFDGDGTISKESKRKDGCLRFGIIGSELIITKIKKIFIEYGLSDTKISVTKYKNEIGKLCSILYYSYKDLKMIYDLIYKNSENLRLERKYIKFSTLKEYKIGSYDRRKISKKVSQLDLNNNIIRTFNNVYDASEILNIDINIIRRIINGDRKQINNYTFTNKI